MKRMIAIASVATILAAAAPATAQAVADGERIMMVTIPEGEECPTSEDPDTIIVCDEISAGDQYRIPGNLRQSGDPANNSWTERTRAMEDIGKFGPGSCTNIGGGSELGCTAQFIEEAYAEKEAAPERRFSQQIEEARQERLASIDGEAARTQSRVEELERAYMERLEAERDGPVPGEEEEALPQVEVTDPDAIAERPTAP